MPRFDPRPTVLVVSRGSLGDVLPFLALARALTDRGIRAECVLNTYYEPLVRDQGLGFWPLGEWIRPEDRMRGHPLVRRGLAGTLRGLTFMGRSPSTTVPAIRAAADTLRPDLMIGNPICIGGPWVAAERGIPWWTGLLCPCHMLSTDAPSIYAPGFDFTGAPLIARRTHARVVRAVTNAIADPIANRRRRAMGFPEGRDTIFGEMFAGTTLGLYSPTVRPPARDDPPALSTCGFAWFDTADPPRPVADAVNRFLDSGPPPVVVGLGSIYSVLEPGVNERMVEACRRLGERVIVVGATHTPDAPNPTVLRVPSIPHAMLFPRAAAIVHHAGIGTLAAAMRSGRPSLILPIVFDQFDNAARARRLGIARVASSHASVRTLTRELDRALYDPSIRAEVGRLAPVIRAEDGAALAADRIAAHLGVHPPTVATRRISADAGAVSTR